MQTKASFQDKWNKYFGRLKAKPVADGNKKLGFMDKMQMLGKTFMLPIATLSFCGILLGIGSGISNIDGVKAIPWLHAIFTFISDMGNVGFVFLPFTFAMAIPIGLCKENKGIAALSAFIAYGTLIIMTATMVKVLPESLTWQGMKGNDVIVGTGGYVGKALKTVLGFKTLEYGVLGGIFTGLLVKKIHDKFQYIKLPSGIAFWGGTRFVPLFSLIVFAGISVVLVFVWPGINLGLIAVGNGLNKTSWGAPIIFQLFVVFTRPAGLHHAMNAVIRFTSAGGTWVNPVTNQTIEGALNIFKDQFAQGGVNNVQLNPLMASILSGGYMPVMIFGLPMVGLAIYLNAPKENRKMVASIVIPGCIATAVGGISEPIEFLFLFVSPLLYVFHALLVGLSYMLVGILGVRIGFTDGNIIDFVINGLIPGMATRWYYVLAVGAGIGAAYFSIWYFYIKLRKVPVVGSAQLGVIKISHLKGIELANAYITLLGGTNNIKELGNCFSRLRIILNKPIDITDEQVKELGAIGLKKIGDTSLQIVVGTQVEALAIDIKKEMNK